MNQNQIMDMLDTATKSKGLIKETLTYLYSARKENKGVLLMCVLVAIVGIGSIIYAYYTRNGTAMAGTLLICCLILGWAVIELSSTIKKLEKEYREYALAVDNLFVAIGNDIGYNSNSYDFIKKAIEAVKKEGDDVDRLLMTINTLQQNAWNTEWENMRQRGVEARSQPNIIPTETEEDTSITV